MRTLFVMDPLTSLNLRGDSTWMLMREWTARGWPSWWCVPDRMYATGAMAWAEAQAVEAHGEGFTTGVTSDRPLSDFDVVWMRKDPPFDMHYIFSTYLFDLAPPSTLIVNASAGLRSRNEKLFAFQYSDLTPETLISRDIPRISAFVERVGRAVLKPWDGNGGRGVLVTEKGDRNLRSMIELLTGEGRHAIIAQRYLPEIVGGDKRIILVDGEPVGAILRVPGASDHRGNMHAGARVAATELSERDHEICARIGPVLRDEGFVFVGIDVIGGWLTEINVTSPTGIQEVARLSGVRIEALVADAVARRYARRQESR